MDCSMLGFPVFHRLPETVQTHVHWVGDVIQPSRSPSLPSLPAINFSQLQSLFQWVSSLCQMVKLLVLQLQYQSFQWIFRVNLFYDWMVWSHCFPRDSQESSRTPQFESIIYSALILSYGPTFTFIHDEWKNHNCYMNLYQQSDVSLF